MAIARGVGAARRALQELRQFESIHELQHAIASGVDVIHREEPIDGILQLRFADGVGNPRHLANPDGTADADDAGIHDPIGRPDEIALGEVVLQGLGIALLQRGGADRKAYQDAVQSVGI